MTQIRTASALLAFPPTTTCGPYKVSDNTLRTPYLILTCVNFSKRLYDTSRWETLTESFRLAIYNLNTLPTEPLLHLALYAGLASLKLPSCYDKATQNADCPVCDPRLGKLASEVPFSHHVNSTIVCRISGKIMDEDNWPMAFPNGYVYSREVSMLYGQCDVS
jgi:macrophage erythroblast attacher